MAPTMVALTVFLSMSAKRKTQSDNSTASSEETKTKENIEEARNQSSDTIFVAPVMAEDLGQRLDHILCHLGKL